MGGEMAQTRLKANFYVDGFNLYYGCVKDTAWKWLDLASLCKRGYPELEITRIRYFTARVSATLPDQSCPQRQDIYLRALKTTKDLSIHFGFFQPNPKWQPLVHPPAKGPQKAYVIDTEEKGSDVNLASYLLFDGFQKDYEAAIVVSNDSDLCEPIRLARQELGFPVSVFVPASVRGRRPSIELRKVSEPQYYKQIRQKALKACQFPPSLTDATGKFSKPKSW